MLLDPNWAVGVEYRQKPDHLSFAREDHAAPARGVLPGDPERAWRRGDVPSRSLAVALGGRWRLPARDVLERVRSLPRQRGLSLDARRHNVRGSVAARLELPPTVCVVDDVYTSGATVDACATACRRAGARRVEVVTFARAVR